MHNRSLRISDLIVNIKSPTLEDLREGGGERGRKRVIRKMKRGENGTAKVNSKWDPRTSSAIS